MYDRADEMFKRMALIKYLDSQKELVEKLKSDPSTTVELVGRHGRVEVFPGNYKNKSIVKDICQLIIDRIEEKQAEENGWV